MTWEAHTRRRAASPRCRSRSSNGARARRSCPAASSSNRCCCRGGWWRGAGGLSCRATGVLAGKLGRGTVYVPMQSSGSPRPAEPHPLLSCVQRRGDDRQPGDPGRAGGRAADTRLRSAGHQRRQPGRDRRDRRRAGPDLPAGAGHPPRAESRLRRRAAHAASPRRPRIWSPTPTATRSTTRPRSRSLWNRLTPDADMVNGYKISRSDPLHRIVIGRVYHHTVTAAVPAARARRGLRLPADAARDLRSRQARTRHRRDLPRDDAQDPGRRLPRRRSAGASLSPHARPLAVLQLPARLLDGRRRDEAVAAARRPRPRPSEHAGAVPQSDGPRQRLPTSTKP